ncbi:MAG: hypothetical protein QF562_01840, partial [Verrucomicrobiota bacterium]|nr:hypothetical protein [Verrucomicrobiota bacterium]
MAKRHIGRKSFLSPAKISFLSGGMNVPAPLFYLAPGQAGTKKAPVMTGAFFVLVGTYFSAGAVAAGGGPSAAAGFLGLN